MLILIFDGTSIRGVYRKDITRRQVLPLANRVLIFRIFSLDSGKIMPFACMHLCEVVFSIMHNTHIVVRYFLRVNNAVFIFHENLSWKPHISAVCDKVSKVIGVLCKSRRYLPLNTLKLYIILFSYLTSIIAV